MKKVKFRQIISFILIFSICLSICCFPISTQALHDVQADENVRLKYLFAFFYNKLPKNGGTFKFIFDFWILDTIFGLSGFLKSDITILGEEGLYYHIEFNGERGYVLRSFIAGSFDGNVLMISTNNLSIFNGQSRELKISQTNMSNTDNIMWTSSNTNIVQCSGQGRTCTIKAKRVGKTTVTAQLNGKKTTCYIYVLDKWKYGWQTTTKEETFLSQAPKFSSPSIVKIPQGSTVIAMADMHSNNKYCYIKYTSGSKDFWGYVPFTALSSQGKYLNSYGDFGWEYPLSTNYINISSYYGQRDYTTVPDHKGVDITGGNTASINGAEVVAVADGTVLRAVSNNPKNSGNYVAIQTNDIDPQTGKNIIVIYMHLGEVYNEFHKEKKYIKEEQEVKKGTPLGTVSNTNGTSNSSMGYHLHFEVTRHGEVWGPRSFANSVNPLWFYPGIRFRTDQLSSWYGMYWSNDTIETKITL